MELQVQKFWKIARSISTAWRHGTCRLVVLLRGCDDNCWVGFYYSLVGISRLDFVRLREFDDGVLGHALKRLGLP